MYDLIIKNGQVVFPNKTITTDVGIKNQSICDIKPLSNCDAKIIIDAKGKYVMPSVIDAHMHVEAPFQGCMGANDFYTHSISAAFGGVTTFMDFTNTFQNSNLLDVVKKRYGEMSKSAIDFGIHGKIVTNLDDIELQLKKIIEFGCPSFKMFMTYKKEGVMASDETLLKVFKICKELGALPMIHAESNPIAEIMLSELVNKNNLAFEAFPSYKPPTCENEAFDRAVNYTKHIGNRLLIVHTTTKEAVETARRAQKEGYPIYVETCPHYLIIFKDIYSTELGHLAICSPPLRNIEHAEALWEGIVDGTISITGSDDCTYSRKEKEMFLARDNNGKIIPDFTKVVNGLSGAETRFSVLFTEGVAKNRISINKLSEILSTNVAKVFGCYPKKGILAVGSDADIMIINKDKKWTITQNNLHNNIDYCLLEGYEVTGRIEKVILRGSIIIEDDKFIGKRGYGQFLKRKLKHSD